MRSLLVLVIALFVGLAAAQELVHEPERATRCWECHQADPKSPAPLRSFWDAAPLSDAIATNATAFVVQVNNGWYHDIERLQPMLDLRAAPSLRLVDGRPPIHEITTGTAYRPQTTVTPAPPPAILPEIHGLGEPARGNITLHVPNGATSLQVRLSEADPSFDPDMVWRIHGSAGGEPTTLVPVHGVASLDLVGTEQLAAYGYGAWILEAEIPQTTADGPNLFGDTLVLRAEMHASFDVDGVRTAIATHDARIGPGQGALFSWQLQRVTAPAPGEQIHLIVNGTAHHAHEVTSNAIDRAHVSKTFAWPLTDDGTTRLDQVTIVPVTQGGGSLWVPAAEILGYVSAFSIVASLATGGVFGKASRRGLNRLFGSARQRVDFHNSLSHAILLFALIHMALFLALAWNGGPYHWSLGLIWGGLALLAMIGLGLTGTFQVPIMRRWNYATWRWSHFALAMMAVLFTAIHLLLDGAHFGSVQEAWGWQDPLDPR